MAWVMASAPSAPLEASATVVLEQVVPRAAGAVFANVFVQRSAEKSRKTKC